MKKLTCAILAIFACITWLVPRASAVPIGVGNFDDTITAIFGAPGVSNEDWVSRTEVGGDRKVAIRFRDSATNETTNDGLSTYRFALGRPISVEYSISSGQILNLSNFTSNFGMDTDVTLAVTYVPHMYDPTLLFPDNSYGNPGTLNGNGTEGTYFPLAFSSSISQRSTPLSFFGIDTSVAGIYDTLISISTKTNPQRILAQAEARVIIGQAIKVSDGGGTLVFLGIGCLLMEAQRRRMLF